MEEQPLAPPLLARCEVFAVPHLTLVIDAAAGFGRQVFDPVGKRDERPRSVVEIALSGPLDRPAVETPCRIHVIDRAPRAGEFVKPRRGELRPVSRDGRRIGPGERLCRSKARERQTGGGHKGTKDGSHMDEIVVCHAVVQDRQKIRERPLPGGYRRADRSIPENSRSEDKYKEKQPTKQPPAPNPSHRHETDRRKGV